jgi:hypothetical protein
VRLTVRDRGRHGEGRKAILSIARAARQVAEITETDYFVQLQRKAAKLRAEADGRAAAPP